MFHTSIPLLAGLFNSEICLETALHPKTNENDMLSFIVKVVDFVLLKSFVVKSREINPLVRYDF